MTLAEMSPLPVGMFVETSMILDSMIYMVPESVMSLLTEIQNEEYSNPYVTGSCVLPFPKTMSVVFMGGSLL